MTKSNISRRDFLKLSGLALGGLASTAFLGFDLGSPKPSDAVKLTRVSRDRISVFNEPSYDAEELHTRLKDELIYVYKEVKSPDGPDHNPRWYKIDGGYAHSARLQTVETNLNDVIYDIPAEGQLGEITVPISLSFRHTDVYGWEPMYRLYFSSVHWVTGIGYGPNLQPWYKITDDLVPISYNVPATHVRLIQPEELTPIAEDVPPEEKFVLVDREAQTLTAFEGEKEVLHTQVSTGMPYGGGEGTSTITPLGDFNVQIKMPVRHMGDGNVTSDILAYELPGVPWVSYFYKTGVAFHGTYWHDNYGYPMSHGCVNMKPDEAKWLWRWVTPLSTHSDYVVKGLGTRVQVTRTVVEG